MPESLNVWQVRSAASKGSQVQKLKSTWSDVCDLQITQQLSPALASYSLGGPRQVSEEDSIPRLMEWKWSSLLPRAVNVIKLNMSPAP